MGKKDSGRREFFRKLAGKYADTDATDTLVADGTDTATSDNSSDPLFRKYARKTLGRRSAPNVPVAPDTDSAEDTREESGGAQARIGNITSGIAPYTGAWDQAAAMHLLRRTGFGLKKARVDALTAAGATMSAMVDDITNLSTPAALPSATPLNHYQGSVPDSGGIALGADWTGSNLPYSASSSAADGDTDPKRRESLFAWSWGRVLADDNTIREKMVHFWYHFIPVGVYDVEAVSANSAVTCHYYLKLLRENALGNFKDLIKAITRHPAMLAYLSGQFSTAAAPNENYGRELLELFLLGKVPTQNYTEDDVKAAARVLSGWRLSSFKLAFTTPLAAQPYPVAFNNSYHNQTNPKQFSAFFNSTPIANHPAVPPSGSPAGTLVTSTTEFDAFFDMLFTHQADTIARYITRRLYRFFVYYDIDANVEANVIVPLADVLKNSSWDMLLTVRTLLKSEHFYDAVNRGVMIKAPTDVIAGTFRTLNVPTAIASTTLAQQYANWMSLHNQARNNMEQAWLDVPNVSGWKAYYQTPTFYQNWINSNTIQQRAKFLASVITTNTASVTLMKMNPVTWVQQFPAATIADPVALLNAVIPYLLPVDLDPTYKEQVRIQTLQNNLPDPVQPNPPAPPIVNPWTAAWNAYVGGGSVNTVWTRLNNMFTTLLQLAEAQLM